MHTQSYFMRMKPQDQYFVTDEPVHLNGIGCQYCFGYAPFRMITHRYWRLQIMVHVPEDINQAGLLKSCQFAVWKPDTPYPYTDGFGLLTGFYFAHFSGSRIQKILDSCQLEPQKIYTLRESHIKQISQEFEALFREFILRQPGYAEITAAMFTEVLIHLGRFVREDAPELQQTHLRSQLAKTAVYIHNHYTENISVANLAEMEHMSERWYRELFREAFGASPSSYITALRMAFARKLLRETNLPIAQVAQSCGYEDSLYFSRLFCKKNGMPPTAYQKGWKKESS